MRHAASRVPLWVRSLLHQHRLNFTSNGNQQRGYISVLTILQCMYDGPPAWHTVVDKIYLFHFSPALLLTPWILVFLLFSGVKWMGSIVFLSRHINTTTCTVWLGHVKTSYSLPLTLWGYSGNLWTKSEPWIYFNWSFDNGKIYEHNSN